MACIRLEHHLDEDSEYQEVTAVHVDIFEGGKKIGRIEAFIVNRQRVAERCFYSAFDAHSADLHWIGCTLMEPRRGRTKLQSLSHFDDDEFDFMYISIFRVDAEYRNSDLPANALRQFLHHPFISGELQFDYWKVSSVAYVLDTFEAMDAQEQTAWKKYREKILETSNSAGGKKLSALERADQDAQKKHWNARDDILRRKDAIPFLRNGFFQDKAIAEGDEKNALILVASHYHI